MAGTQRLSNIGSHQVEATWIGVMANQAAKKTKQKNQEILNNTRNIILAVLVSFWWWWLTVNQAIYVLYRVFYHFGSFSFLNWIGFFVLLGLLFFCFFGITALAKCSYNSTGELVDGGADLSGSGLVEYDHPYSHWHFRYYFDVLYLTLFVLFASMFSEWFWLTFLLVPLFICLPHRLDPRLWRIQVDSHVVELESCSRWTREWER